MLGSSGKTRVEMITYIKHYSNEMSVEERLDILQMIVSSPIPDNKIQTKGNGSSVRFSDIPKSCLVMIFNYIKRKIEEKKEKLRHFSDDDDE